MTITVTNLNDIAPVFSSGTTGTEAENTAISNVVYDANASDADAPPFNAITFALSAGGDNDLFNIDATTGAVTFKASPNFEAAADADHDNAYQVIVHANDGVHGVTRNVTITVTDLNDNSPVFNAAGTTASASEGLSTATVVYDGAATDADLTPANNTIAYSLTGADAGDFVINASTGAIRFAATPDFEIPADANTNNAYQITLHANDGVTDVPRDLTISVTNVAPSAIGGPASGSVNEGATASTAILTATSSDRTARRLSGRSSAIRPPADLQSI